MTRRGRLVTIGVLAVLGYGCLTPFIFLGVLVQGHPSELTADPTRLALVVAVEMGVVAAIGYGGLVAAAEGAYVLQRHVRRRAGLEDCRST